ncbi:phosphomannomutase/phosphoglucomutase [bacterium]|nr:phosphomannomutase/phosphoglucomutase [bacterium]
MINWDSAFGKNDIRGIYGKDVTEELFFFTSKAYIKYIAKETGKDPKDIWVTVCMDARNHSPQLKDIIVKGVTSTGANIVDLGLAPTPIGYYSEFAHLSDVIGENNEISGAMIVTASHNPSQYNGLKMTFDKKSLNETQFQEIKKLAIEQSKQSLLSHTFGKSVEFDIIPEYINELYSQFKNIGTGIKVVVDSANGTGGIVGPDLYRRLGCNVIELYSNPDGRFPHHHPNPSDESTLNDIKKAVVDNNADLGIAFDGDSDRIGVIDKNGVHLTGDKLLLIYALDVIERYRLTKTTPIVVSEVKCSQVLFDTINNNGGKAVMCKTGHGFIKSKMKEENAHLAGEMSGHIFFKDRYYGYDDAFYAGCRIIEILAKNRELNPSFDITDMLKPFDEVCLSDEVRLHCENELKKPVLAMFENMVETHPDMFGSKIKEIITLDGMRIVFDGGFALVRQSNTEPVFTLRFEAKEKSDCENYKNTMITKLEECVSNCNKS